NRSEELLPSAIIALGRSVDDSFKLKFHLLLAHVVSEGFAAGLGRVERINCGIVRPGRTANSVRYGNMARSWKTPPQLPRLQGRDDVHGAALRGYPSCLARLEKNNKL